MKTRNQTRRGTKYLVADGCHWLLGCFAQRWHLRTFLPVLRSTQHTRQAGRQAAAAALRLHQNAKFSSWSQLQVSDSKQQQQQPTGRTPRRYDKYLAQNMLQWMTGLSNLCRDNSSNGGETSHQPTEGLEVLVVGSAENARCYPHSSSENGRIDYVSTICWFHLGWPATSSSRPRTKRRRLPHCSRGPVIVSRHCRTGFAALRQTRKNSSKFARFSRSMFVRWGPCPCKVSRHFSTFLSRLAPFGPAALIP